MRLLLLLSLLAFFGAAPIACLAADSAALQAVQMAGDYAKAKQMVLDELRRLEAQRPQNQRRIIRVLGQLSRLSSVMNELPVAEAYEQQALALAQKQEGLHPLDLLDLRHQIGLLQNSQGKLANVSDQSRKKLKQAQETFQLELAGREALFGDYSAQNIHTWRDIAENYESQRRCVEAYRARMKEFDLLRAIYGEEHFAMANIYMDLGRLNYKMEKFSESIAQYGVALRLLTKHDAVANCLMIREAEREIAKASSKMAIANTRLNWL